MFSLQMWQWQKHGISQGCTFYWYNFSKVTYLVELARAQCCLFAICPIFRPQKFIALMNENVIAFRAFFWKESALCIQPLAEPTHLPTVHAFKVVSIDDNVSRCSEHCSFRIHKR